MHDVRPVNLRPIIEDRRLVQEIALDLLEIIQGREEQIARTAHHRRIIMLCVGAAFSLWRAVPLVHVRRQPIDNVIVSGMYLEQIVRHNAINYSDDDRSRAWSFGFYLSNARYRLAELCKDDIASKWPFGREALDKLGLMQRVTTPRGDVYDTQERVRDYIVALQGVVGALKQHFPQEPPQSSSTTSAARLL